MNSPIVVVNKRKLELDKKFIKIQNDRMRLKKLEDVLQSLQYRLALDASPIVKEFCNLRFENICRLKLHLNDPSLKKKDKRLVAYLIKELAMELQSMGDSRADSFTEKIESIDEEQEEDSYQPNLAPLSEKITINKSEIKNLFRQLAKIFHPDIETNEALKEEKTVLMKKINEAYVNQDLYGLLKLEKEHIGHREFTDDNIDNYIKHINEQLKELKVFEASLKKHGPLSTIYRFVYSEKATEQDFNILSELKKLEAEVLEEKEFQQSIWDKSTLVSYLKHGS